MADETKKSNRIWYFLAAGGFLTGVVGALIYYLKIKDSVMPAPKAASSAEGTLNATGNQSIQAPGLQTKVLGITQDLKSYGACSCKDGSQCKSTAAGTCPCCGGLKPRVGTSKRSFLVGDLVNWGK